MISSEMQALAAVWIARDEAVMDIEVIDHRGSVPRECGTRMLVTATEVAGTIGGGHLEFKVIEAARGRLALGAPEPQDQTYALGPSLGQCCGGTVTLRTQLLTQERLASWPTRPPLFRLQLYGAGHVGRAIVKLLRDLDCAVQWFDERDSEFPLGPLPGHIEKIVIDGLEREVHTALPGYCYLVLTHSHALDLRITEAILRRGDFQYLGLIGSETKRARFVHQFKQRGIDQHLLESMTCPIGLNNLRGKEPEIIAISVVAQILQTCV